MKKYINKIKNDTDIYIDEIYEGESIEQRVEKMIENNEPIKDGAPLIYTDKKDGVLPGYDIRTDRFDVALDAMQKIQTIEASKIAKNKNIEITDKSPKDEPIRDDQ